jgi:hypothetical protein
VFSDRRAYTICANWGDEGIDFGFFIVKDFVTPAKIITDLAEEGGTVLWMIEIPVPPEYETTEGSDGL